jgi:phosphate starvation-inducible PhoH-like protein
MVVNGDLAQSDVGSGSGLSEVINRLEGMNGIAVCELGVSDIVRHHLIGEILKRLDSNVREDEYDVVHATAALI